MERTHSKKDYDLRFPEKIKKEALKNVLDIRKFEINLYWKRATYFWTFIAAAMAGYISLLNSNTPNPKTIYSIILLGIIFSACWYLVNRASKYWQLNWEKHLDAMEDSEIGPLYKTTINREYYKSRWYIPWGPLPYSVSKINILLSLFVFFLWVSFLYDFIHSYSNYFRICNILSLNYYGLTGLITIVFLVTIVTFARTGKIVGDEYKTHINFITRTLSEDKE